MKIITLIYLVAPLSAFATVTPDYPRGESIVSHEVNGRKSEVCVIPKHLPTGKYSKKDAENEKELCDWNIGVNVAACAKENSTNPGVLFLSPPKNVSVADLTANCEIKNSDGESADKEAKYKLSTSCSYAPSLLAYYHMSRALGNIVNVPPAVLRTLDLERHIALAKRAIRETPADDIINKTWRGLLSNLEAGSSSSKADLLFTDNYDQSYGALQKNPKKESFYKEFFNSGEDRVAAFRDRNPIYKALINPALRVERDFVQKNVQAMLQLRDASDMILLDTILGQQDRFGNIHAYKRYYYIVTEDGKVNVKSEKDKKDIPEGITAVEVKEMILKDNDCGVAKENRIRDAGLLDKVSHISPSTYKNLMALNKIIDQEDTKKLFTKGFVFTETDFKVVSRNLREAAKMLKEACAAGRLKLDLSLDKHFSTEALPTRFDCEI